VTVVYYHDGERVRIDEDNLSKPIQDALIGLVYADDRIVVHAGVRKENLDGVFRVRRMSRVLAEGFSIGDAFQYVRVEELPFRGRSRRPTEETCDAASN
jgi:crossover junction endodeoxyribonuclease RusA